MQNDNVIEINQNELNKVEQKDIEKAKEMFLYTMEYDQETGFVRIFPMNRENGIVIHGEKEARFFTGLLLDYYRTE